MHWLIFIGGVIVGGAIGIGLMCILIVGREAEGVVMINESLKKSLEEE